MDERLMSLAEGQHYPVGTLYVVATPLGNTADITVRALYILGMVDAIACEDTRNSAQLLQRYGIDKPLIAAHQHNENEVATRLVERLRGGERIAYISDAGTPGISDPGARLVDAVRATGLGVVPVPGASAVITLLSAAGAWVETFTFVGFLPSKAQQRAQAIAALAGATSAQVFYEAPHRIVETVAALADGLGGARRLLIGRELTKRFEEIHECALSEGVAWLKADANRQRGEFVLAVSGAAASASEDGVDAEAQRVLALLVAELPTKSAAKLAAAITGAPKNALYERALALKNG
ncbi:16S rRNA (cytidine(1402)-2'-O)-methyltransferase [Pandoraea sp. XJJ-1]|uniref:16S rRNA (cytidine(1402)-2'-O)-methyltransferase n=1 Tax=unclassified Pandoraea TaxID=2624094 RepID=UPI0003458A2A|nr:MULTISPECIES: 16S rRNA (cytidine(1402)-2'-O)-methyltransferase [unclassified Pandoraea]OJY24361.1 MAG: 16S rRNA (cytidine(1402)-2'-O)-methyltransferase [Pandoraea sp. 64-18]WAL82747.1 16S rRNA (cytidine(1402)-2'-O)-methyltransferase [Pandoraea sp. XJJ-1]